MLNRDLLRKGAEQWTDELIRMRTREMTEIVISIWPVPIGHKSPYVIGTPRRRKKVRIPDLIGAGVLQPGITLFPRSKKFEERIATLLADGTIEVDGKAFTSPSDARELDGG
jgi:hypothetical protein